MNDKSCPTTSLYLQRAFDAKVLWRVLRASCLSLALLAVPGAAHALCGGSLNDNNFRRPIDVNAPADKHEIYLVEKWHFTPEVAALIRGSTSKLPGDIHYTLKHIPNHYGALDSMARYQLKNPAESPEYFTADCYFERALACRPKDGRLYMLDGLDIHRAIQGADAGAEKEQRQSQPE